MHLAAQVDYGHDTFYFAGFLYQLVVAAELLSMQLQGEFHLGAENCTGTNAFSLFYQLQWV